MKVINFYFCLYTYINKSEGRGMVAERRLLAV